MADERDNVLGNDTSTVIANNYQPAEEDSPVVGHYARSLTTEEIETLKKHDSSLVSDFKRNKLELEAAKNWDLFYKRNKTNFYKDRHWTLREFEELSGIVDGKKKVRSIIMTERYSKQTSSFMYQNTLCSGQI